ncbi:hypothetical protein BH23ACT9_BH23ACT9_08560 [soil metagenome]
MTTTVAACPEERPTAGRARRWGFAVTALAGPIAIAAAAYAFEGPLGSWALWLVLGLGAVWMLLGHRLARDELGRRAALLVIATALLARALLVPLPFITSTDAYRYLWDGRVQAADTNPYRYPPGALEVAHLRDDAVYPLINRKGSVTIYPPVAQGTFLAAHLAGLRTPTGWKALLLMAEAGSMALLLSLAGRRRDLVLYAWNPVPIIAFGLAGHLDALLVLAVLAAVVAWRRDRLALVGTALGVAAGLKLWPLLLLPAFWRRPTGRMTLRGVATVTAPAVGVLAASYLPYVGEVGRGVLGFLVEGFLEEDGYVSGARFQALQVIGITNPTAALLTATGIAGLVGILILRSRADAAARATWLFGTAVLLTTPHGWYATPLIALSVAGTAGLLWAWFPLVLYAAYLTFFHNVWSPWLGEEFAARTVRRAGLAVVAVVLMVAAVHRQARSVVLGATVHDPAGGGPRR